MVTLSPAGFVGTQPKLTKNLVIRALSKGVNLNHFWLKRKLDTGLLFLGRGSEFQNTEAITCRQASSRKGCGQDTALCSISYKIILNEIDPCLVYVLFFFLDHYSEVSIFPCAVYRRPNDFINLILELALSIRKRII